MAGADECIYQCTFVIIIELNLTKAQTKMKIIWLSLFAMLPVFAQVESLPSN